MNINTNTQYTYIKNPHSSSKGKESPVYYPKEIFVESSIFPDYYIGNFGTVIDKRKGLQVNHRCSSDGYIVMSLRYVDPITNEYKYDTLRLHRVIMMAHCPIINTRAMQVNHIDGIKYHNVYYPGTLWDNLEWSTSGENVRHSIVNKLRTTTRSKEYQTSYMSDQDVHMICSMFAKNYSIEEIMNNMGMEHNEANRIKLINIKTGHSRKDISSQYNMPKIKEVTYRTEAEVRATLSVLQDMKRMGYSNNQLAIFRIKQEYGFDINDSFIQALRGRRTHKWLHIVDEYDI